MSSILNDETFNDTNKVKAMHSLVEIEKMNLKNILEQKSIIEAGVTTVNGNYCTAGIKK